MDDGIQADLPRLIGTHRQVAWATTIRERFLALMAEQLRVSESNELRQSVGYRAPLELHLATQRRIFAAIRSHAQACAIGSNGGALSMPQLADDER